MTSRSYIGKMNSTLGSVVPLVMFSIIDVGIISVFDNCIGFQNQGETSSRWGKERSRVAGMFAFVKDFKKKRILLYTLKSCNE